MVTSLGSAATKPAEIGDDYIPGVWRDDLGVEFVRCCRPNKH